jgi:hypothetical protein
MLAPGTVHRVAHTLAAIVCRLSMGRLVIASLFVATAASAHVTGTGLATLQADGRTLHYRLTFAATDIAPEFAQDILLAANGDRDRAERVAQWLRDHVRARVAEGACRPGRARMQRSTGRDDRLVLELDLTCPATPVTVELDDTLPGVFGEHWNTIVSAVAADGSRTERIVSSASGPVTLPLAAARSADAPQTLLEFIGLGIEHIATGVDHLLFLLALLLGVTRIAQALVVVSVFTLAHATTFTLATLQLVTLSPAIVEPAIALSIAWMAWESVRAAPSIAIRVALTFGFGLVHGLGFATALQPLELQGTALVRALIGFALGVEAGQVAFVGLAFGALHLWAQRPTGSAWRRRIALGLVVIGLAWFLARVTGIAA